MIVVMQLGAGEEQIKRVESRIQEMGFKTHPIYGEEKTVIGAIGDKKVLSSEAIIHLPGVEKIVPIMKPYKRVSRELKQDDSTIPLNGSELGGEEFVVIAGPCAVEGREQMLKAARLVKEAGAKALRGGAFKPRTSPYAFQGMEKEGLKLLAEARAETGLPIVTEAVDPREVELVAEYADVIQIGARNMQNFRLLKEAGQTGKTILLKRGASATIEEWLMAAEYVVDTGNEKVILCERGLRTFENATRNTLDLSAVPVAKANTHLPVIVDPSHAAGNWRYVLPLARAAVAVGADGLIVEVHPDPSEALCDGSQSLNPENFQLMMQQLSEIARAVGRKM